MKKQILKAALIVFIFQIQFSGFIYSQSELAGNWEGAFMNDFKTLIEFKQDENNSYSGKIQMYAGANLIQDDLLSQISVKNGLLFFRIESKDTDFKGKLNSDFSELTGVFIFPDKTEHPLKLLKRTTSDLSEINLMGLNKNIRNKKFRTDELKDDLFFLANKLDEQHPDLYHCISKKEFDENVHSAVAKINTELTIIEFYNRIAPIVERVKCSHTGIRLPEEVQKEIYLYDHFLPLKLLVKTDKVFCVKNYLENEGYIFPGDEILSINGVPMQEIIEKLSLFIPSEGNNITTKYFMLNQHFNTYFNLIDNSKLYEIEIINSKGKQTVLINACNFSLIEQNSEAVSNEMPVNFYISNINGTGYLTLKSFMIHDINGFIQKINDVFLSLQKEKIKNLVLDLRGNSGGHPIFAAQLFSYLTDKEFTYFKRNADVQEFEPLYNKMQADKIHFNGEIYVLVDGGCLSTTGHLISLLKSQTNAIFVGEAPGSTNSCNDFSIKVKLPNTGIEANIPRTTFETAVSNPEETDFYLVDYEIENSVNDYLNGIDNCIRFVNNLVLEP